MIRKIRELKEQLAIASFVVSVYEKRHNDDHAKYMELRKKYDELRKDRDKWESLARKLDAMRLENINGRDQNTT